ncbi:MAG: hypothetical protein ACREMQ_08850, partial [Longimicrobiales bacterium]
MRRNLEHYTQHGVPRGTRFKSSQEAVQAFGVAGLERSRKDVAPQRSRRNHVSAFSSFSRYGGLVGPAKKEPSMNT